MQKFNNLKKGWVISILLAVLVTSGVVSAINHHSLLAGTKDQLLVDVKINGKSVQQDNFVVNEKEALVEIVAKQDQIIAIPFDDDIHYTFYQKDVKKENIPSDLSKEELQRVWEKDGKINLPNIETSSEAVTASNEVGIFIDKEKKAFYLAINSGESVEFQVINKSDEKKAVTITNLDNEVEQSLLVFSSITTDEIEKESQATDTEESDYDINQEKNYVVNEKDYISKEYPVDNTLVQEDFNDSDSSEDKSVEDSVKSNISYGPYQGTNFSAIDNNDPSTWVPEKFDTLLNFENSTVQAFGMEAVPKENGFTFQNIKPNASISGGWGVKYNKVNYMGTDIDLVVRLTKLESGPLTATSVGKVSAISVYLRYTNGMPFIAFNQSSPIDTVRYRLEFYKHGTETPIQVNLPLSWGDIDGTEQAWIEKAYEVETFPKIYYLKDQPLTLGQSNIYGVFPSMSTANIDNFETIERVPSILFTGEKTEYFWVSNTRKTTSIPYDNVLSWWQTIGFLSTSPYQITTPRKYVSDSDEKLVNENTLEDVHETYMYTIDADFPATHYSEYYLKNWHVTDSLPSGVSLAGEINVTSPYNSNKDVTSDFLMTTTERPNGTSIISVAASTNTLKNQSYYSSDRKLRINIPVKITDPSKVEIVNDKVKISNTARLSVEYFTGKITGKDSNEVYTTTTFPTLAFTKSVDKEMIEVGGVDEANLENSDQTEITYTIDAKNESSSTYEEVRILDSLPNNQDSRGTKISGSYEVNDIVNSDESEATLYYSMDYISEDTDPYSIDLKNQDSWIKVEDGKKIPENAQSFLWSFGLSKGKKFSTKVSITPINNMGRDKLVNNATLNSEFGNQQMSESVTTVIKERSISGISWYDNDNNGYKDDTDKVAQNIPVKFYRTSLKNPEYVNELVKETLTGEKLVDENGDSLVKTDENGEYTVGNLPEGEYVVFFDIEDEVNKDLIRLTIKDSKIGSQERGTSKISQDTLKSDKYVLPLLTEKEFNSLWKVQNLNVGLVQPSNIRVYKYEEGSPIDVDKDGYISDLEKNTGNPLSGAVFDIYEGKNTNPSNKIDSATTDSEGFITFQGLYKGDYTLVEKKAPEGYELIKYPIYTSIETGNATVQLYVSNIKSTELPFAGTNEVRQMIIIIAGSLSVVGLSSMLIYFNHIKVRKR
ncbi:SpaA isopeptide-forming pilin-related protein [Enterococcus faecalis]|uniref:SpaA isopeptide-forming pilin-related protein n=1 Tax=Enterococcus faecalis TaxID=1351 RepID=UPI0019E91055|nr:hypothetical protein [Enterococcus faecalis]EGO6705159.1 hypothetical protein [Enterococcus faecalis]